MSRPNNQTILVLDLHQSSFGFVLLREPDELLDWGIKSFRRGVNAVKVPMKTKLSILIDGFRPDAIVVLQPRNQMQRQRLRALKAIAHHLGIAIHHISKALVQNTFPERNRNKYEIASFVADIYPELSPRLGPRRRSWEAERYSISIFDAAAVGIAYIRSRAARRFKRHGTLSPLPR